MVRGAPRRRPGRNEPAGRAEKGVLQRGPDRRPAAGGDTRGTGKTAADARFLSGKVPLAMGGTVLPSRCSPGHPRRRPRRRGHPGVATDERAARRTLRDADRPTRARARRRVRHRLSDGRAAPSRPRPPATPACSSLGELEVVRDELAERLREARVTISRRADEQAEKRLVLERMLLRPADYKFVRISCRELGRAGVRRVAGAPADGPDRHADGLVAGQALVRLSVTRGPRRPAEADRGPARYEVDVRPLLRTGTGALLVVAIMFIGSLGLWVGTPLLWLWVGSQIQGATQSLGTALAAAFFGVVLTVTVVASLLVAAERRLPGQLPGPGPRRPGPRDARGRARGQRRPDGRGLRGLVLLPGRHQPRADRDSHLSAPARRRTSGPCTAPDVPATPVARHVRSRTRARLRADQLHLP